MIDMSKRDQTVIAMAGQFGYGLMDRARRGFETEIGELPGHRTAASAGPSACLPTKGLPTVAAWTS